MQRSSLAKAFNIEPGEGTSFVLLLTQSVFLGVFNGVFDIAGNALFLGAYPSAMLPKAFTISGIAGIIMTLLYTTLQGKLSFKVHSLVNLSLVAILTFLLWFSFMLPNPKWQFFATLVLMGPLRIVAMVGFWGTAGRLYNLRQGKRLFGQIDAGQILGMILSSYTIPVLIQLKFPTVNLILLCVASLVIALFIQVIIIRKFSFEKAASPETTEQEPEETEKAGLKYVFSKPYTRIMAFFVILSMVIAFFVYYTFLAVTNVQYPNAGEMAKFLGMFTGTVMIFTLLFKTLVYSKLMKTYGLRTSLLLTPIVIGIFALSASLLGSISGYTPAAGGFAFFFIIILLSRLFSMSLKESIESPSFKILYQSLDAKVRYDVQARVDGTINEFAALFAGILLAILGALSFITLIHFIYLLFALIVVWGVVAWKLYSRYKRSLNETLLQLKGHAAAQALIDEALLKPNAQNDSRDLFSLRIFENLAPEKFTHKLVALKDSASGFLHKFATERLKQLNNDSKLDVLPGQVNVGLLAKSARKEDRIKALKYISESKTLPATGTIMLLMRDSDPEIRKSAMRIASDLHIREAFPVLVDHLHIQGYSALVAKLLTQNGTDALDMLENAFNKSGTDLNVLLRIIRIYSEIGGERTEKLLLGKITHSSALVSLEAAKALIKLGYQSQKEDDFNKIQQATEGVLANAAWVQVASYSAKEAQLPAMLCESLDQEYRHSLDHMFSLLSLAYDANTIQHIREATNGTKGFDIGYALELLDQFLAESLKPQIFALLEDNSPADKIHELQIFHPVELQPAEMLLKALLNRNYNSIGIYTKACTLLAYKELSQIKAGDDVIALLSHPDPLLQELAVSIISAQQPELLKQWVSRFSEQEQHRWSELIDRVNRHPEEWVISKANRLRTANGFCNLPIQAIVTLARNAGIITIPAGQTYTIKEAGTNVMVLIDGEASLEFEKSDAGNAYAGELLYLPHVAEKILLKATMQCTLYRWPAELWPDLAYDYHSLLQEINNINFTNVIYQ